MSWKRAHQYKGAGEIVDPGAPGGPAPGQHDNLKLGQFSPNMGEFAHFPHQIYPPADNNPLSIAIRTIGTLHA